MRKRRYELDPRIFTVFFFVAVPFIAFGALVVIDLARAELQRSMAVQLEQRARQTQQLLVRNVLGQYTHLHLLSLDNQVQQALAAPSAPAQREEAQRLDQAWGAGDAALVNRIVHSPLATRLRELGSVHPGLKLLQLVDRSGRLVASSARGGRLLNAEASWFRALGGTAEDTLHTKPYFVDVTRGSGTSEAYFEIAYPVRDEAGSLRGAVRAVFDSADLYSLLASVQVGRTGHALLVRASDGVVLASDRTSHSLREKFPGFGYVQNAQRERRASWVMPEVKASGDVAAEPARVVGFSAVEQIPGVEWLVVVEQDLEEAIAPVRGVSWYLLFHFIGVFAATTLLAAYFSLKLEAPVIEEELHLHEEHVPKGYPRAS